MNDAAVRELAGRAGIAVEWRDYANEQHRVSAENLRRILAALQLPCDTAADLAQSRRQLETSRLPPLITATTGQPFEVPARRKSPGSGAGHLRGRHDCGPSSAQRAARRAAARHRDAGLSRHRVRQPSASRSRSRRRAATRLRTLHQRSACGGSRCKSTACAAPAIAASATPPASSRLPARLPAFGQTPSRSAPCTRCLLPIQTISVRIRRRAGSSTIPFMPTRERCSATLASRKRLMTPAWLQRRPNWSNKA